MCVDMHVQSQITRPNDCANFALGVVVVEI